MRGRLIVTFSQSHDSTVLCNRLDAVQDLLDHPTFEKEFTKVAKGLPDLERIVSRIHAKNCRVKDFLKVLTVCDNHLLFNLLTLLTLCITGIQDIEHWIRRTR